MLIEAQNLEKVYGDLSVLKGVSLSINKGEFVAIVGPSGAGKSTLLHLLGSLDKADSGSVRIMEEDLYKLGAKKQAAFRNKNIGFVFQSHHLLPEFSAVENVAMPLYIAGVDRQKAEQEARVILETVGMGHRLQQKRTELSGGEQQRVAIARAVVQKPAVLFADEPTGNLDTGTAKEINHLSFKLVAELGITLVVVTHNEALAQLAHRVFHMKDGRIERESINQVAELIQ